MGIVSMKCVTIFGAIESRDAVLEALQRLGTFHAISLTDVDEPPGDLAVRLAAVQRVVDALQDAAQQLRNFTPEDEPVVDHSVAISTVERVEDLLARQHELSHRLEALRKERDQIAPWGDLNPADLDLLAEQGVFLSIYPTTPKAAAALDLREADWDLLFPLAGGAGFGLAVLRIGDPVALDLEPAVLPTRALRAIEVDIAEVETALLLGRTELRRLAGREAAVRRYRRHLMTRLRAEEVKVGVVGDGGVFALSGWCPAEAVTALRDAVQVPQVAVVAEDPAAEEEPPILLRNPPLVRQFQPLLTMFSLPHYREYDPTPFIALPMALFVGFCLGDLGYGLILTLVAVGALLKLRPRPETRLIVDWLAILGVSTVLVGGLTGNVFGLRLYELLDLSPTAALFTLSRDPKTFFFVSLGFGAAALSLGLLIKLVRQLGAQRWQEALSTMGWILILPGLAAWALAGTPWVFVMALALVLGFASTSKNPLHRLGSGAWAAYNISGLAGDVMSYVRIFGLGLSSGILAMVINTLALLLVDIPWVGWPLCVVFLVVGHTFNFVLAMVGAVVHSARLQFLEFLGKFFEGGGRPYLPFAKLEGE